MAQIQRRRCQSLPQRYLCRSASGRQPDQDRDWRYDLKIGPGRNAPGVMPKLAPDCSDDGYPARLGTDVAGFELLRGDLEIDRQHIHALLFRDVEEDSGAKDGAIVSVLFSTMPPVRD